MPLPHYIDVDLKQTTYLNEPKVTQNDEVTFIVRVTDDGQEFKDLNTYSTFTMASVRPDKQPVLTNSTSVIGNEITFILGTTEIAVPGRVEAAIQLYDVNGRISSIPFSFMVIKDKAVGYIPSEKEQTLIELVLGQGPAILNEAKRVAEETIETEELRIVAESNRVNEESQRVTAESNRETNENDRLTNEIARVEAEALRNNAEDIRIHAEEDRQTNTSTAIQNAENATKEAENATEAINLILPDVLNLEYIAPYNATMQYLKNNIVRHGKNSYIALQDTKGNEPTGTIDSPFWGVIAIGGMDGTGTGTVTSVNGVSPVDGNVTITIPDPDLSSYVTKEEIEATPPVLVEITRGSQVVTVPKDSPVYVIDFYGKTVVNHAPLFDSGLWVFNNVTTTNSPSKITVVATANYAGNYIEFRVKSNTIYTLSSKHNGFIGVFKPNFTDAIAPYTANQTLTFNTGDNTIIRVTLSNTDKGAGTYTFENVMLNEASVAQEFVANAKGIVNPTIANETTGESLTIQGKFHEGDNITSDGIMTRKKKEIVLDNSLDWKLSSNRSGFKEIRFEIADAEVTINYTTHVTSIVTKYNGKVLQHEYAGDAPDRASIIGGNLFISILNTDSGWGDSYTPNTEEIKAYFNGYQMGILSNNTFTVPYNGSGTKAWRYAKGDTTTGTTVMPTTVNPNYDGWQPYRLIYNLATPVIEPLKTTGSLTLTKGDNVVEVTDGRIVRERVFPIKDVSAPNEWNINNGSAPATYAGSLTKYKIHSFVAIYKNGKKDNSWTIYPNNITVAGALAKNKEFDPTAIYEVDYIPLEPYQVSTRANPIQIEFRDTLGGVVEGLVSDVSDLEKRVSSNESVLEKTIKSDFAKKTQESWKVPILQNGWATFEGFAPIGYYKDEFNVVHLRGVLKGGTMNTAMFTLPVGYRPSGILLFPCVANTGSTDIMGRVQVDYAGQVYTPLGGNLLTSLNGISFKV